MSALLAYQVAHRGVLHERDERAMLNRDAAHLAELLADNGREYEPEPDLTLLWDTSNACRHGRPRDYRFRRINGSPYQMDPTTHKKEKHG